MMSRVIFEELHAAGAAFFCGILITLVYDLFRIFRRVIPHGNVWISMEDLLFWIWTTLWVFSVFYRENDGSIRIYTILAMGAGMLLYHGALSEMIVRVSAGILKKLLNILGYPLKMVKIYMIFFGKKLKKLKKRIIMKLKRG